MIRYICEPEKNTECRKTFCQEYCKATAFEEYAKRDEHGAPIVAKDFEIIPQIKINREVFEKCEEETETITVSKGCLKARKGRFVVYDVEYLKNHIEQEAAIYGNVSAIEALKKSEWIPCSERLPEEAGLYLVSMHRLGYPQREIDGFVRGKWERYGNNVIAWMPLPEEYKKEGEK